MKSLLITTSLLLLLFLITGCSEPKASEPAPARKVTIAQVLKQPAQTWQTYTTRLQSPEQVALTARVSGVIDSIEFTEGEAVKKGDVLFRLDRRPFEVRVDNLSAQIEQADAALTQARSENNRARVLVEKNAISTEDMQARRSRLQQQEAMLKALKAQHDAARLELEFATVTAPIDGIVSKAIITRGNHVTAGETLLTTIVSQDKMHAYFDVDERTWNHAFTDDPVKARQSVVLQRAGDEEFGFSGYVDFVDNKINEQTGTINVRAVFPAPDNRLKPGGFARIKVAASSVDDRILIPERAIGTDLENKYVLVLGENNTLAYRVITPGERYGTLRAVEDGLKATDKIVVNGPGAVAANDKVSPEMVEIDTSSTPLTLSAADPSMSNNR